MCPRTDAGAYRRTAHRRTQTHDAARTHEGTHNRASIVVGIVCRIIGCKRSHRHATTGNRHGNAAPAGGYRCARRHQSEFLASPFGA